MSSRQKHSHSPSLEAESGKGHLPAGQDSRSALPESSPALSEARHLRRWEPPLALEALPANPPPGPAIDVTEWYERFDPMVRSIVRRRISDPHQAEDIIQTAWTKIIRGADLFDPARGKESTFIGTIAFRTVVDYFVEHGRVAELRNRAAVDIAAFTEEKVYDPASSVEKSEQLALARQAIEQLPGNQRRIAEAFYMHRLTIEQISDAFAVPLGTVKSSLARVRVKLATTLGASRRETAAQERFDKTQLDSPLSLADGSPAADRSDD